MYRYTVTNVPSSKEFVLDVIVKLCYEPDACLENVVLAQDTRLVYPTCGDLTSRENVYPYYGKSWISFENSMCVCWFKKKSALTKDIQNLLNLYGAQSNIYMVQSQVSLNWHVLKMADLFKTFLTENLL